MVALSDTLLASGCALHIEAIHGEELWLPNGEKIVAVREVEQDQILMGDTGPDARAKIVLRFRDEVAAKIGLTAILKTGDGRRWQAVRRQEAGFLTNDYELTELTKKDQA